MVAPVLLRHTDVGAPQITAQGQPNIYEIFKWGLPQLGWTMPFDDPDTNRAAFRNSAAEGTGGWIAVEATGQRYTPVRAYTDMTAVATGDNPTSQAFAPHWPFSVSGTRQWFLAGDNRTIYFFAEARTPGAFGCFTAGDFIKLVPSDVFPFYISGTANDTDQMINQNQIFRSAGGSTRYRRPLSVDGSASDSAFSFGTRANPNFGGDAFGQTATSIDGSFAIAHVYAQLGDSPHARMRGLLMPSSNNDNGAAGGSTLTRVTPNGSESVWVFPISPRINNTSANPDDATGCVYLSQSDWGA